MVTDVTLGGISGILHITPDSIDVLPMQGPETQKSHLPPTVTAAVPAESDAPPPKSSQALRLQFEQLLADVAKEEEALTRARQQAQRIEQASQDAKEATVALEAALESSWVQRVRAQVVHAARAVKAIKKQDLEEVRALHHPPRAVEKAMALLFWVLTPASVSASHAENTLEAEEEHLATNLRWKDDLRPMLKPGLAQKISEFPPPEQPHPLLARPGVLQELQARVVLKDEDGSQQTDDGSHDISSEVAPSSGTFRLARSKSIAGSGTAAARSIRCSRKPTRVVTGKGRKDKAKIMADHRDSDANESAIDDEGAPLTSAAVARASLPVAALFEWVLLQLRLAVALSHNASISGPGSEADSSETVAHERRKDAAERACTRAAALQSLQELEALFEVTTTLPSASSSRELLQRAEEPGLDGLAARKELEVTVQRLGAMQGHLGQLRETKMEGLKEAEVKVAYLREHNAVLRAEIQEVEAAEEAEREAALAASGPPKCEACGSEKVLRQTTLLNSEHFGHWYWRCNRCRTKEFDDSIPMHREELLHRLMANM